MQEDKIMIFIDGANLLKSWITYCNKNNLERKRISYSKLTEFLSKENKLIRTYFYDAIRDPLPNNQFKFFDLLRSYGITVKTKTVQQRNKTCKYCNKTDVMNIQKGVDVSLVTDLMSLAFENAYDLAIIVSGDNDFSDAVNYIKSKGKKCWIASFKNSLSGELKRTCDKLILLDDLFNDISENKDSTNA